MTYGQQLIVIVGSNLCLIVANKLCDRMCLNEYVTIKTEGKSTTNTLKILFNKLSVATVLLPSCTCIPILV